MTDEAREELLQGRQDGRLYPLGRALRDTYHADNHETLDGDVTGLMIDLSKLPYERVAGDPAPRRPSASEVRPSILSRLGGLLGRR